MEDNTNVTHANDERMAPPRDDQYLVKKKGGVRTSSNHQMHEPISIVPHPRTLRKAREQVKQMVNHGFLSKCIRRYLYRWVIWWTQTAATWEYHELLRYFIDVCRHEATEQYASPWRHRPEHPEEAAKRPSRRALLTHQEITHRGF